MAKKKEAFVLSETATVEEALAALRDGNLTHAQYLEWDAARVRQLQGRADGQRKDCPITLNQFLTLARPITLMVDGQSITLEPREYSSGSFGFGYYGKVTTKIGEQQIKLQASISLVVANSKKK